MTIFCTNNLPENTSAIYPPYQLKKHPKAICFCHFCPRRNCRIGFVYPREVNNVSSSYFAKTQSNITAYYEKLPPEALPAL
ncbi:hypothetical protein [Stenoxybacter acetivorans]|uniref:hypothetical protein n=1 Tax=Stenoxybacter acetivorans TaxID=422441 RepID=UPI0012EB6653|nr:hypothetical protein [Stenoxybacter acetivorans]